MKLKLTIRPLTNPRFLIGAAGALLAAPLGAAGCGATGNSTATATSELAASTSSLGTGSDLSSAPELAGLMAGLMPPRIPDGVEGFRCDPTPDVTTTTLCGREFPTAIVLDWTGCQARLDDHGGATAGSPGGARHDDADGGGAGAASSIGATSAGHVSITNTVTVDPAVTCTDSATYTFARTADADVTTTETDGTSAEVAAHVASSSTRQPSAQTFSQHKSYQIARTDRDAAGAATRASSLTGDVSESFDGSAATPLRLIDGTLTRDRGDGTTSTLVLTGIQLPAPGLCRWPTAGTITETVSDGTSHTLVLGSTCGQATLDGAAVTLPAGGVHLEGGRDDCHGGRTGGPAASADGGAHGGPSTP